MQAYWSMQPMLNASYISLCMYVYEASVQWPNLQFSWNSRHFRSVSHRRRYTAAIAKAKIHSIHRAHIALSLLSAVGAPQASILVSNEAQQLLLWLWQRMCNTVNVIVYACMCVWVLVCVWLMMCATYPTPGQLYCTLFWAGQPAITSWLPTEKRIRHCIA